MTIGSITPAPHTDHLQIANPADEDDSRKGRVLVEAVINSPLNKQRLNDSFRAGTCRSSQPTH